MQNTAGGANCFCQITGRPSSLQAFVLLGTRRAVGSLVVCACRYTRWSACAHFVILPPMRLSSPLRLCHPSLPDRALCSSWPGPLLTTGRSQTLVGRRRDSSGSVAAEPAVAKGGRHTSSLGLVTQGHHPFCLANQMRRRNDSHSPLPSRRERAPTKAQGLSPLQKMLLARTSNNEQERWEGPCDVVVTSPAPATLFMRRWTRRATRMIRTWEPCDDVTTKPAVAQRRQSEYAVVEPLLNGQHT